LIADTHVASLLSLSTIFTSLLALRHRYRKGLHVAKVFDEEMVGTGEKKPLVAWIGVKYGWLM
jgi:hypothetical protein